MKKLILKILFVLLPVSALHGQVIKGRITNPSGQPVPFSTVYIQELRQGTTANAKGDYEIRLSPGKYTVIYQSLGYEQIFITITITDRTITKDVVLPVQYYQIPEVRISATGEDPAYIIMRKAIAMAPYYLNNISSYKAEVYLKGNMIFKKIPKLLQKSMKMSSDGDNTTLTAGEKPQPEEIIIKEGDSFLMESLNEIEFTAPDRYIQKMISFNSTFPEGSSDLSPMDYIEASFYQPVLAEMAISPLSPQAFSHYRFRYQGATLQGNFTINKIEVIPKRKSQQLFEGTIYIVEDLWCLHSVDLKNLNRIGEINIEQLYIPVHEDIWMPVSHKFEIYASILGFKADAGYGGSIKYTEVKPNLSLRRPGTIPTDYAGRNLSASLIQDTVPASKTRQQIDQLMEKEDLTNRDMIKLARLMEKETDKNRIDTAGKDLEIRDNATRTVEKDAAGKDSSYWAQIRPIPLTEADIKSLRVRDSLNAYREIRKQKKDSSSVIVTKKGKQTVNTLKNVLTGHTWGSTWRDTSAKFRFVWGGLVDTRNFRFNTVDGFIYGLDFSYQKFMKGGSSFSIYPELSWAFSRKEIMWRANAMYNLKGKYQKQVYFRIGSLSRDAGNGGSINPLLNTVTSLFFEKNYLKLYGSEYYTLGYKTSIANGLTIEINGTHEIRKKLENSTNYSVINTSEIYSANIPQNSYLDSASSPVNEITDQAHTDITARISFTPFQRYRIRRGQRIPGGSEWPTFTLTWQHGINNFEELSNIRRNYDMIRFEAARRYDDIGAFSEFSWRIRAGGFIDNRNVPFYDFFHFNPQPPLVLLDDYRDAFMLPSYYTLSTPEAFAELHVKYTTPYLLLKLLPGMSNTLMRENLSLSCLGTKNRPFYTEIGYSISEILFFAEAGIYVGFDDSAYRSIGAKIILKLD